MSNILYSDDFKVSEMNPEGKKFDQVDRLIGAGLHLEGSLLLDIHSGLLQIQKGDLIHVALMSTTNADGRTAMPKDELESRLRSYDYAMHGVVYKNKHVNDELLEIHLSHGGLLARFNGKPSDLGSLNVDSAVYTLVRKKDKDLDL